MSKVHITVIASLLAAAAIFGAVAATHTIKLGAANHASAAKTIETRTKQLDKFEASLRHALAKKPPALPAVPASTAATALQTLSAAPRTGAAPTPAAAPQQRVIYRRPPPIVVVRHTSHGDDGAESEQSALGAPDEGNDD
ncbi:MAG: hypothetical protein ACXWYO_03820 [Gaiellaceae bacterium]